MTATSGTVPTVPYQSQNEAFTGPARATMRIDHLTQRAADPDLIYFVKTSMPHVSDISVSGPYYPAGMAYRQIINNLAKSSGGLSLFLDAFPDTEGGAPLHKFHHLTGPLDEDPRAKVHIELVRQHNPVMAAKLPGPAYNVLCSTPSTDGDPEDNLYAMATGYLPLEDVEIHGSFATKREAEASARLALKDKLRTLPQGRELIMGWDDDAFTAAIHVPKRSGGFVIRALVQARLDQGVITRTSR